MSVSYEHVRLSSKFRNYLLTYLLTYLQCALILFRDFGAI